jgi:hypothetical protein
MSTQQTKKQNTWTKSNQKYTTIEMEPPKTDNINKQNKIGNRDICNNTVQNENTQEIATINKEIIHHINFNIKIVEDQFIAHSNRTSLDNVATFEETTISSQHIYEEIPKTEQRSELNESRALISNESKQMKILKEKPSGEHQFNIQKELGTTRIVEQKEQHQDKEEQDQTIHQKMYIEVKYKEEESDVNQKVVKNGPKGDNIYEKDPTSIRILYQNINSLRPQNLDKWKASIERVQYLECDMVGLSETCINWSNNRVLEKYKKCLNKARRNSAMYVSSCEQETKNQSLPGGTATIILGKLNGRVTESITDLSKMGRWSGVKLRINDNQSLFYITAYRVCDQRVNKTNSLSTSTQQYYKLKEKGHTDPRPRKQFILDMQSYLNSVSDDNYVILALDANESMIESGSDIKKLATTCNLVDIYSHIHNDMSDFPTHTNGSKKIDHILCSNNVIPFIEKCGVVKFHEALDSDHRAIFCDISEKLFNIKEELMIIKTRQIGTNSTNREGEKYINYINDQFKYHRIYEKVENLYTTTKINGGNEEETMEK